MLKNFQLTQSGIEIGATIDTPPLHYVLVKDLDQSLIKVPYRDPEIEIRRLIANYLEITSCKHLIKDQVYFIILQGYFKSQTAIQAFKLSSLDLQYHLPCFKVAESNKVSEQSLFMTQSKLAESQKLCVDTLKVKYNEEIFEVSINIDETVFSLKQRLLKRPQFQNTSIDMLRINLQNRVLLNSNKISDYKGLVNGSMVTAIICKSQGCFRSGSKITLPNNKQVEIEKLEIGEKVLSYNVARCQFEQDEITYIHKSRVSEELIITLEDKSRIQTTSNHMFLCNDNQYRKFQYQQKSEQLKVGTLLKHHRNKSAAITSIELKRIYPPQEFHHFFIKNNHNFIVNHAIAHNMYYYIDYLEKHRERIDFSELTSIIDIKKHLEERYQLHIAHSLKIIYSGNEIGNSRTLSDFGVGKQSKVLVTMKDPSEYSFIHPDAKVKVNQGFKMIKDIKEGDTVAVYQGNKEVKLTLNNSPQMKRVQEYYKVIFQNNTEVSLCGDSFLELANGEVKMVIEILQIQKKQKDKFIYLKTSNGNNLKIMKIQRAINKYPGIQFYKLSFQQASPYILFPQVIIYNRAISISINIQNQRKIISIGIDSSTKIQEIKFKVSEMLHINKNTLQFYFNNELLPNQTTFQQQKVKTGDLIQANSNSVTQSIILEPLDRQQQQQKSRIVELLISSNEKYQLQYDKFSNKTVQQIMKYLIPNYKSSYFFLYSKIIILPTQKFNKIQSQLEFNQFNHSVQTIIVVKNEKLSFVMNMDVKSSQIHNISYIIPQKANEISLITIDAFEQVQSTLEYKQSVKRLKSNNKLTEFYKQQIFYKPFLYIFNPAFRNEMRNYIKNFEAHLLKKSKGEVFKVIKSLYINLIYLPNHITRPLQYTFFGVRNFKFASFFNKNDTFYLYEYLFASNDQAAVKDELQSESGTLFRLISTTGKMVNHFSIRPPKKVNSVKNGKQASVDYVELLFPPYTYFLVNKIVRTESVDEIWISEIASPMTLQKDIVLWVDDIPKNNETGIKQMLEAKDLEVLPLISTLQAEKWLKEFGWLMKWKGINFKIISDMGRLEYKQNEDGQKQDYEAGFELVDKIYNKYGLTVKSYIFCGKKPDTENLLLTNPRFQALRQKYNQLFKITDDGKEILKFCCNDSWQ